MTPASSFRLVLLALAAVACRSERGSPTVTTRTASAEAQAVASALPAESEAPRTIDLSPLVFPSQRRIALGGNHSCFIDERQKLWCWGANDLGEIGNGQHGWQGRSEDTDEEARVVKQPFSGYPFEKASSVYATGGRTCAASDVRWWCWGGLGSKPMSVLDRPVEMSAVLGPIEDVALSAHECAIARGKLSCWGDNHSGAVGSAAPVGAAPMHLAGLGTVLDVAASSTATCAVKSDHSVWCWGGNDFAERGEPKSEADARPRRLPGVSAVSIEAGWNHFCGVTSDHRAFCWGQANVHQLGNPVRAMEGIATPQFVDTPRGVAQVVANAYATLALLDDGRVFGWGRNAMGLLGHPDRALQTPTPTSIPALERIVQIAVGAMHACALREDETVWCWGQGDDYQLGNGLPEDSLHPVRVVFP